MLLGSLITHAGPLRLAGIAHTLDHHTGREMWTTSYFKCGYLDSDMRGTERDQISRRGSSRGERARGRVV